MPIISGEDLTLLLEGNLILDKVSFEVKKGEYVGLIGPNGAGKTSLIKVILGFYKSTKGCLKKADGIKIGYVPQNYALSSVVPISVLEVLHMSGVRCKKRLVENLQKVGLEKSFFQKNFHQLSGGQKQRVIITRALCSDPELLIFDEPLNGVDFETKLKIYELLKELNQKENLTILFVSHEVEHIIGQCDRILCLNKTMHDGCHPLDFAKGNIPDCPVLDTRPPVVLVHHHHDKKSSCSF